jgi:hypothetical protein
MKTGRTRTYTLIGLCVFCMVLWMFGLRKQLTSVQSDHSATTNQITEEQAMEIVSKIHKTMTFAEISKIVTITPSDTPRLLQHGGIVYLAPVGSFVIALRFAYPNGSYSTNEASYDSVLNLDPIFCN